MLNKPTEKAGKEIWTGYLTECAGDSDLWIQRTGPDGVQSHHTADSLATISCADFIFSDDCPRCI